MIIPFSFSRRAVDVLPCCFCGVLEKKKKRKEEKKGGREKAFNGKRKDTKRDSTRFLTDENSFQLIITDKRAFAPPREFLFFLLLLFSLD